MSCVVPANKPIYEALLAKAAAYPADKPYQARAYKKAAETVREYTENIYDEYAKYCGFKHQPMTIGKSIEAFIYEFIKAGSPATKPTCAVPANEPIYIALMAKAATYDDVTKDARYFFKAKAWRAAADKVAALDIDLQQEYDKGRKYYEALDKFGPSTADFIDDYCVAGRSSPAPAPEPKSVYPVNNSLSRALLTRAEMRELSGNKYAAAKYREAADKVIKCPTNIYVWYKYDGKGPLLDSFGGPSIVAFIKYYLNELVQTGCEEYALPTDAMRSAEEALKIYCLKEGFDYKPSILEEYRTWRPTASISYYLEKWDAQQGMMVDRTPAEIATHWASVPGRCTELTEQIKKTAYSRALIKYCKKHNYEYRDELLTRLNAWREEPENKKKLVWRIPACHCGGVPSCSPVDREFPMGAEAVVNRWFAAQKKTLVFA